MISVMAGTEQGCDDLGCEQQHLLSQGWSISTMGSNSTNYSMKKLNRVGHKSLIWVQDIGLLIIAMSTVVAVGIEIRVMIDNMTVTLADLLLLFIYLEVLSMVAIYLDSGKLPVRMPLYISIVALARYLILDMKEMETWRVMGVAGAALLLAFTVLVIRFGHIRYPYEHVDEDHH
jgi:protein PsiE